MNVLSARRLSKDYGGRRGVFDLSFDVAEGEVFGFLGPNGAGKTTTIRMILDLIRPTAGRLEVFGLDSRRDAVEIRRKLGYVPGDLRLYDKLTARELLTHFAALRGMDGIGEAKRLAGRLELELDAKIKMLSRGNRQKVGLVQALMHRPQLLVLDEPTSGLDPLMQQEFHAIVREATAQGRTVFLSSHVLSEVQHVADRVALVRDGRLVLVESIDKLRSLAFTRVEATFETAPAPDDFAGVSGVEELDRHGSVVLFSLSGPADPLVKALARHRVIALDIHEADLEDVFLDLYRAGASAGDGTREGRDGTRDSDSYGSGHGDSRDSRDDDCKRDDRGDDVGLGGTEAIGRGERTAAGAKLRTAREDRDAA